MQSTTGRANSRLDTLLATSGVAQTVQLIVQLALGVILLTKYSPNPATAHQAAATLHHDGLFTLLQGMHYWGSALLILHGALHVAAMVWLGAYRDGRLATFYSGILIFLLSLGFQLSGNVLPFDRHGVQTAGIEAGIAARAPIVGPAMAKMLLGGNTFNDHTLGIWFALHAYVVPVVALAAIGLAVFGRRQSGAPAVSPVGLLTPFVLLFAVALLVPSPLGSAATPDDYGAFAAKVSWYVWPLHGTMRLTESLLTGGGWIGAMVLPGLLVGFVALLPWIGARISPTLTRLIFCGFAAVILGSGIFEGGAFAPLTGTRDPVVAASTPSGVKATAIDKVLAAKGKSVFNNQSCKDCHGADGLQASGGPSLAKTWQKHPDADYYERYIKAPTSVQPDSTMPPFPNLPAEDLRAIAEYLRSPK